MKKLFLVFGFFAIIVSVVSADITISGLVGAESTLLKGTFDKDDALEASGLIFGRLQAVAQNENGTFGGLVRVKMGYNANEPGNTYAWAWWKPIDQVRLQIGFLDALAVSNLVNWSYNENDAEDYIAAAGYEYSGGIFDRSTGFYNGTWWTGALLSVTPIQGLTFNLAAPFGPGNFFGPGYVSLDRSNSVDPYNAADVYQHLHGQVTYTIDRIGRAALSFKGGGDGTLNIGGIDLTDFSKVLSNTNIEANASTIYASFYLFAFRDMSFNVGLAYTTPTKATDLDITYNSPVAAGLGFSYKSNKFTLKSRFALTFAGKAKTNRGTLHDPIKLGFGILPSYDFNILKLYFNAGISYKAEDESADISGNVGKVKDTSAFAWHVNPYITKQVGPGTFFGGICFESYGIKHNGKTTVEWSIPIAMQYEF